MANKVHYPPELKWNAVHMKLAGHSTCDIMKTLGIKYKTQIKVWMKWYRHGETHRFHQPLGKQYTYNKRVEELSKVDRLKISFKWVLGKITKKQLVEMMLYYNCYV